MNTGLTSFTNPGDIGVAYPFAGLEVPLVIVGFILWALWHVWQAMHETEENEHTKAKFEELGIDTVLYYGGAGRMPSANEKAVFGRHE